MERGSAAPVELGAEDLGAMPPSLALVRRSQEVRARVRTERERARQGRSVREILQASELARLYARLATMPVIEQAKGIIIAQSACPPEEAFDRLRRASQRANIKLHERAVRIVEQAASSNGGDDVTPLAPRRATRQPTRPARAGAPVHEHAAAAHARAAVLHDAAAAFFDDLGRADEAARERDLADGEKTKAAQAREAAIAHGED